MSRLFNSKYNSFVLKVLHAFAGFFEMHMASIEVDGEGSSMSCYDSVVKYLLLLLLKGWAQTEKTAKKRLILHSGPLILMIKIYFSATYFYIYTNLFYLLFTYFSLYCCCYVAVEELSLKMIRMYLSHEKEFCCTEYQHRCDYAVGRVPKIITAVLIFSSTARPRVWYCFFITWLVEMLWKKIECNKFDFLYSGAFWGWPLPI